MEYKDMFTEFPDVVGVDDLTKMLGIGRNKAYELVNSDTIKSIRIGTRHRIPKFRVVEFIENTQNTH